MKRERKTGKNRRVFDAFDAFTLHVVSVDEEEVNQIPVGETELEKKERIAYLLEDFVRFCKYYFADYMRGEFGWFHIEAYEYILNNRGSTTALEFPRGHAKSVLADILIPLFLKAKGELTGMMIISANQDKAIDLMTAIRDELVKNARYIHDFGLQTSPGSWKKNSFTTRDGIGFWAFGIEQTPRGVRRRQRRPNYCVFDDFDTDELCRNEARCKEVFEKMLSATIPALEIEGSRVVYAQNRIHKKSILARVIGDIDEDSVKNEAVKHIKVYALENPETHEMDMQGVPAWSEYYSITALLARFAVMQAEGGDRLVLKEYFHQYSTEGTVFKAEFIDDNYIEIDDYSAYEMVVTYLDPSWKDTKKSDFKALFAIGKKGTEFHVLDCWVKQDTTPAMVQAHYEMGNRLLEYGVVNIIHLMEGGMLQDIHLQEYQAEGERRGWLLPIREDLRDKPDKKARIETLTAYRNRIKFNRKLKSSKDFQEFKSQLINFPRGHDDGPDALEGGVWILNDSARRSEPVRMGQPVRQNSDW